MKTIMGLLGIMGVMLMAGCEPKSDARITKLEARLATIEARLVDVDKSREAESTGHRPVPQRASVKRGEAEPTIDAVAIPQVLSVTGRVTEGNNIWNNIWWRWATIVTIGNTSSVSANYDLGIQMLDKDGFPIDQSDTYGLSVPGLTTNKVMAHTLVNLPAARNIKSFKAMAITR